MGEETVMQHTIIQVLKIKIEYNTMEEAKSEDLRIPRSRGSFQGRKPFTRALDDEGGKGRNCGAGELSNLAGAQCTWEKWKW